MTKKYGIVKNMILNTVIVSVGSVVFIGIILILYVFNDYNKVIEEKNRHAIEDRKNLVKNEVDKICEFSKIIDMNNKKKAAEEVKENCKVAVSIFNQIYSLNQTIDETIFLNNINEVLKEKVIIIKNGNIRYSNKIKLNNSNIKLIIDETEKMKKEKVDIVYLNNKELVRKIVLGKTLNKNIIIGVFDNYNEKAERTKIDNDEIVKKMKFGNNWEVKNIMLDSKLKFTNFEKQIIEKVNKIGSYKGNFFLINNEKTKEDKLIFAEKATYFNSIIFAEVPLKDLKVEEIKKKEELYRGMAGIIGLIVIVLIMLLILIFILEGKLIKKIEIELNKIIEFFDRQSIGKINEEEFIIKEFNKIAESINIMIERKEKVENELIKAKEAAESSNVAKSKFISNTSHEIRTPMNGVIGTIELLKDTELSEEQAVYLKIMEDSADHLSNILNDVLDIAKIESGKVTLEMSEFSIEDEVEKIATSFFSQGIKKGVEVLVFVDKKVPTYIIGDNNKINQIIINLVGNAVKFTQKGSIFIGVEKIGIENDDVEIKITVEDSGIGIPTEKMDEIFNPFEQVDMSYTKTHQGTGLGLTITKNLVELMNGRIVVNSSLWNGTTFELYLKLKDSTRNFIEKKSSENNLVGRTIVICDNSKKASEIYKKIFEAEGSIVESCIDEKEIVEIISKNSCIDIIIIKKEIYVKMEEYERKRVKEVCKNIILITSFEDIEKKIDEEEIKGYISKPIKRNEIIMKVEEILKKIGKKERCPIMPIKKSEKKFKIVIAEDNEMNRMTIGVMFQKMYGVTPIFVENGEECIEISGKENPDIIFMDIQMPVMNGIEATEYLKKQDFTRKIPVIGVTAYAYSDEIERFKKSGMEEVLTKPLKMEKIGEVIDKYLKY